jgi:hypothetical protein
VTFSILIGQGVRSKDSSIIERALDMMDAERISPTDIILRQVSLSLSACFS